MPFPARHLTHENLTLPIAGWADRTGLSVATIRSRIDRLGWTTSRALTTPPDRRFRRGGRPRAAVPRPVPALRRHAGSGRAFARWRAGGRERTVYFGPWGTPEATAAYRRFAAEWVAGAEPGRPGPAADLGVGEVIARRIRWAAAEYTKHGRSTSEVHCQRAALRVAAELYGDTPAAEFGPAQLRAVRAAMVARGWCRATVNHHLRRVVAAFAWAAGEGWLPPAVPAALREVRGLKAGRSDAPDRPRRKPVPDADVERTLPHLSPRPARRAALEAMVRVQRLTGMRPGEVCALRPADLDRASDVWVYRVRPEANKNAHRDKPQAYYLGPRSQAVLLPYLGGRADAPAFPVGREGYRQAVVGACKRAGVPAWTPHQLRHALATEVAREAGSIEAAAAAIGDTPETAARHYIHTDPHELAKIRLARDRG